MTEQDLESSAGLLWRHWQESRRIAALPERGRAANRAEGYAIQSRVVALSGQAVAGWKIAATSPAGQAHIGVDGPLAGRLLANRVVASGAPISLDGNLMRVAEAEFAFRLARDLEARELAYEMDDVMAGWARRDHRHLHRADRGRPRRPGANGFWDVRRG